MTTPLIKAIARAAYTGTHRHCFNGADPHPDDKAWESFKGDAATIITALTEAGYAIVPVEPTPSMISGAWKAITAEKQHLGIAKLGPGQGAREVYRAMLAAAPPLDTKEGE